MMRAGRSEQLFTFRAPNDYTVLGIAVRSCEEDVIALLLDEAKVPLVLRCVK
jgi:hypothetical protein